MGTHSRRAHARKMSASRRRTVAATATMAVTLPVIGFMAQPANGAEEPIDCASGRVFVVPGTADPNSLHTAGLATRYGTDDKNYRIQIIDYPGQLWPAGGTSYDESVAIGTRNLEDAVQAYADACEGKPVVIVGYSQGARIAGDVLADIGNERSDVDIDSGLVTGELYSDPRREGDRQGRGIELILPGVLPGITMNGSRGGFGAVDVTQFCVEGDPICDLQDPLHYPLRAVDGLLGYFVKHVTYDDDIENGPDASSGTPDDVLIPSDPAIGVILGSLGLPYYNFAVLDNPLPYPDLAVLRPLFHAVNQLLPSLPDLGHGAYLPDLYVLRDALAGDPAAWQHIGGSAISILNYPANLVRDWIAEIDRQLDDLDGARLGVTSPIAVSVTTDVPEESGSARSAASTPSIWIEPQDVPPADAPAPQSTPSGDALPEAGPADLGDPAPSPSTPAGPETEPEPWAPVSPKPESSSPVTAVPVERAGDQSETGDDDVPPAGVAAAETDSSRVPAAS